MPCYHPLSLDNAPGHSDWGRSISRLVPCGQCIGCRLERSRQWAVRIMHECQMHERNCFVTLTYEEMPDFSTLVYRDFQLFMKDVRRKFGPTRFFVAGEYGEEFNRPHFHACLFGIDFRPGRVRFKKTGGGFYVDRSSVLESLWPHGFSSVGELTFESAAYIARYVVKKVCGDEERASRHYRKVNFSTGEIVWRKPEFVHMSLKPGIGAKWFEKFGDEVFPIDRVVARGVPCKPPKYYDALAKRVDPDMVAAVKVARVARAKERGDNTEKRLRVKEVVATSRARYYKRELR